MLVKSIKRNIDINDHKNVYETAEYYIESTDFINDGLPDSIKEEMIKRDTIISIQAYPKTPIGFIHIVHYDMEEALSEAIKSVENY